MTKNIKIPSFANIMPSSRLYGKSSFRIGMGSVFNLSGDYYDFNYFRSAIEADNNAIRDDWDRVGADLRNAIYTFSLDHGDQSR